MGCTKSLIEGLRPLALIMAKVTTAELGLNPYATPRMTPQPSTSGHDSSDEINSRRDSDSDDISGSTHFYDNSSEASSSQEPGSSDEGYPDDNYTEFTISGDDSSDDDIPTLPPGVDFMTGVGGVRLEAEYIYNGSATSSVGESRASSPDLDNQGEQDEKKEERKIEDHYLVSYDNS